MSSNFFKVLLDSVKLFFINVFIYSIFLEGYLFIALIQDRFNVVLPFVEILYIGVATLLLIVIWMNVARVWYPKIRPMSMLIVRAICSELPFVMLLAMLWFVAFFDPQMLQIFDIMLFFSVYMVLFPVIIAVTKSHTERAK